MSDPLDLHDDSIPDSEPPDSQIPTSEAPVAHDHVSESGEDIDNYKVAAVGLAGSFLIAVAVLLVQALYMSFERADTAKKYGRSMTLTDYKSEQAAKIGRYRWVDQRAGVVAVPIERAMTLIAKNGLPEPPPPSEPSEAAAPTDGDEGTGGGAPAQGDEASTGDGEPTDAAAEPSDAPSDAPSEAPSDAPSEAPSDEEASG